LDLRTLPYQGKASGLGRKFVCSCGSLRKLVSFLLPNVKDNIASHLISQIGLRYRKRQNVPL
ncbi:hypothetical protein, partial [Vibrio anguillarum]|uniref:hypothetical protein n=1 Tax=Vibrio anguillarum TaxID=55601 RepID=UPI001BE46F2C